MQHDRGCVCQECTSTSVTDTVLVGVVIMTAVVIAISTGSRWFAGAALVVLVGLVVRKLRAQGEKGRPRAGKGLG